MALSVAAVGVWTICRPRVRFDNAGCFRILTPIDGDDGCPLLPHIDETCKNVAASMGLVEAVHAGEAAATEAMV